VTELKLISVNNDKCVSCGICAKVCPAQIIELNEGYPFSDKDKSCISCGHCVAVCPHGALDNSKTPLSGQKELSAYTPLSKDDAQNFMRSRRSIRNFKKDSVSDQDLKELVDLAHYAPSASNSQGVAFHVVRERELVKKMADSVARWMREFVKENPGFLYFSFYADKYFNEGIDVFLRDAPHLIFCSTPVEFRKGRESSVIALSYLELFAPVLGLGSCWAGLLEFSIANGNTELIEMMNIPPGREFSGAVMAGYPVYHYKRLPDREPLELHFL
jgi:nitroreductase/NAD-dependent dihydropyrimidine dehydrogenase PreA subunit